MCFIKDNFAYCRLLYAVNISLFETSRYDIHRVYLRRRKACDFRSVDGLGVEWVICSDPDTSTYPVRIRVTVGSYVDVVGAGLQFPDRGYFLGVDVKVH